jgi:hypothetical protein
MYHPDLASAEAQVRYDELLERAETYRRIKRLQRSSRGPDAATASTLSDALIALGGKVGLRAGQTPG